MYMRISDKNFEQRIFSAIFFEQGEGTDRNIQKVIRTRLETKIFN